MGKLLDEISPTEAGYLTRGPRRAVVTALVMLHRESAVVSGRPGAVKRGRPRTQRADDPLMRAIYRSLSGPMGVRALRLRPRVDKALVATRRRWVAGDLLLPMWRRLVPPLALLVAVVTLFRPLSWDGAVTL